MSGKLNTPELWRMYLLAVYSHALEKHGPAQAGKVFGRNYKDALELSP